MLRELHAELGIPEDYGAAGSPPAFAEATDLVEVGPNLVGRTGAVIDAQTLELLEFDKAGQAIEEILKVNAAPGYSEHHTGRAVDIATPGSRPLTEEFEDTDAFRWLESRAIEFGFSMTYPRDNPWGIAYEPWHWSLK